MPKKHKTIRQETLGGKNAGELISLERLRTSTISIKEDVENNVFIERVTNRSKVKNFVDSYELVGEDGNVSIEKLTLEVAHKIVDDLVIHNKEWSDAFVIYENNVDVSELNWEKTEEEHKFTSTGIKFWRHERAMENYKDGNSNTVISTHISPEGACNLKCPYCSVTYRDTHSRIPFERIQNYVLQLKERGLKAVILTGGGEPTLYKHFNELVSWLKFEQNLSVGLITNGTQFRKFDKEIYKAFSWIRISVNVFENWEDKIGIDFKRDLLNPECVVGCSMVYTVEHELSEEVVKDRLSLIGKVSKVADRVGAEYVRLLPNCLLEQKQLLLEHQNLQKLLEQVDDKRFFQQYKIHGAPKSKTCHQAYFRPYLSEEPWHEDGEPGTVYPCDSVVLNDSVAHFEKQYQICKLEDVGKFFDRKIQMKFDPRTACRGCVFTDNVNMLDDWLQEGKEKFDEYQEEIKHEEFV